MYYDLAEFDPFEPIYLWDYCDDWSIDNYPMTDDDWEEWLANDEQEQEQDPYRYFNGVSFKNE